MWILKYIFCALGHPILFFIYLFTLSGDTFDSSSNLSVLFSPIYQIDTNLYRINFWLYIPFVLIIYTILTGSQYAYLHYLKKFSFEDFLAVKFTPIYLVFCGLAYFNLLFWLIGMEGNVFGFIFFLPMMLLSICLLVMESKLFFAKPPQTSKP